MKSRKMNAPMKKSIEKKCLSMLFDNKRSDLAAERKRIAFDICESILPDDFKIAIKLPGINPEWFSDVRVLSLRNNYREIFSWYDRSDEWLGIRVPNSISDRSEVRVCTDSVHKSILDQVNEYELKVECLEENVRCLKSKLDGLLSGVDTTAQLEKLWPDGREYYDHLLCEAVYYPVAVLPVELNKLINELKS